MNSERLPTTERLLAQGLTKVTTFDGEDQQKSLCIEIKVKLNIIPTLYQII